MTELFGRRRWLSSHALAALVLLASSLILFAACGGGSSSDDSGDDDDSGSATPRPTRTPTPEKAAMQWTTAMCEFQAEFRATSAEGSRALAGIDARTAGAKDRIVGEYRKFQAGLDKYAKAAKDLPAGNFNGGAELRTLWLALIDLSVVQLAEVADDIAGLPSGAAFPQAYDDLVGDSRDDNSDQNLRGKIRDLQLKFPLMQVVIDTFDDEPACKGVDSE